MLIALSSRTAICQSDAEVLLTGVVSVSAVSHRLLFFYVKLEFLNYILHIIIIILYTFVCKKIVLTNEIYYSGILKIEHVIQSDQIQTGT